MTTAWIENAESVTSLTVRLADGRQVELCGRPAWALARLYNAGSCGLTTAEMPPGVRWSHFIWKLRKTGVAVSTEAETHGGAYAGHHARYRLACVVDFIEIRRREPRRAA